MRRSLTDNGATGAVTSTAFAQSDSFTLGVEEELILVDQHTREPAAACPLILDRTAAAADPRVKPELMRSDIEIATGVHRTPGGVLSELQQLRQSLSEIAADVGCRILSAGMHPDSGESLAQHHHNPGARYESVVRDYPWISNKVSTYALHVHVGMDSPQLAIRVFNQLRPYMPAFLALSASSPINSGEASGLHSLRNRILQLYPRSALPPNFSSWAEFDAVVDALGSSGSVTDSSYLWWYLRPHPKFGTIEVRVCDAQPDVRRSASLAALIQATCRWIADNPAQPDCSAACSLVIEENIWLAARYGMQGSLIDIGHGASIPAREAVRALVTAVEPYLSDHEGHDLLAELHAMIEYPSSLQQLDVWHQAGTADAVTEYLLEQTVATAAVASAR